MQLQSAKPVQVFSFSPSSSLCLSLSTVKFIYQRLVEAFRLVLRRSLIKQKLLKILHNYKVFAYLFSSVALMVCGISVCLESISLANENAN